MTHLFKVHYSGGESRWYPGTAVDFMLVTVEDADGDEYQLYAEINPSDLSDEQGIPAIVDCEFNPQCDDPERLSAPYLIQAIREMCAKIDLDPTSIDFDGYDRPDCPQYMMPYVSATYRIS